MFFNSLEFAVFFVVVYALYLVLPRRAQNVLLLVASYVFYGAWNWKFLGLIALSTVIDYSLGLAIAASEDPRRRKRLLICSLVSNLGILGFFKYADFFSDSFADLAGLIGWQVEPWVLGVVLPVGISFYTFQTLSYTIDVYRGSLKPTRSFLDFALFVAFFPQLVAGPIERASRLLPQILKPRSVDWGRFGSGSWLVLAGIFKKVVVADNLGRCVGLVYAHPGHATGLEIAFATYAFAWQIYCDFSGYTDVARGVARMMGFDLMLNFNLPYIATNPADFWRRWHISLSTWLRDYLYIPLGGNRSSSWLTYRNLALTMLLGGLWHGAAWTYVVWGAYQGGLLIAHRLASPALERLKPRGEFMQRVWWLVRVVVMFQLVCLGWMIFRAESLADLRTLLVRLVSVPGQSLLAVWWKPFVVLVVPLAGFQLIQAATKRLDTILRWPLLLRSVVYAVIFLTIVLMGEDGGSPFIYFQF